MITAEQFSGRLRSVSKERDRFSIINYRNNNYEKHPVDKGEKLH